MTDVDGNKAVAMWNMGFGDMNERLFGSAGSDRPEIRALRSDWKTLPMPLEHADIELGIPVTRDEYEALAMGHVPHAMEDHWFMYFATHESPSAAWADNSSPSGSSSQMWARRRSLVSRR